MPSSLVFAALAVAWIVVLVPMVARRRQEVRRTADSALAARVVRRGDGRVGRVRQEEVTDMPDIDDEAYDDVVYGDGHGDTYDDVYGDARGGARDDVYGDARGDARDDIHVDAYGTARGDTRGDAYGDDEPVERRHRPGRGGFDPHAAELAARAKYGFRQRVVFGLLLTALATGLFAGFALPTLWWAHAAADALLVGYLAYLRRQVRIEQEIRQRRLDRAARARRPAQRAAQRPDQRSGQRPAQHQDETHDPEEQPAAEEPRRQRLPQPPAHPGATLVDLDDEDPALHELDGEAPAPYRRAAGE